MHRFDAEARAPAPISKKIRNSLEYEILTLQTIIIVSFVKLMIRFIHEKSCGPLKLGECKCIYVLVEL
jgi:hypothetical protein